MPTTAPEVVVPFVHINGTSAQDLLDLRCETIDALHFVGAVLARMSPNARDYYPATGRMDRAVAQHRRRVDTLKSLVAELEAENEHIVEYV